MKLASRNLIEFSNAMSQMFHDAPFGYSLVDRDFRYVYVNKSMAAFNGSLVEDHLGKTIGEVNAVAAQVLEPIIQHAIEEKKSLVDLEAETEMESETGGAFEIEAAECAMYWRIGCYLLRSEDGGIDGFGIIVRDITDQKLTDAARNERLKVELVLADISSSFINIPASEVDSKVEQELQKIVDVLGFDRCTIWQFDPEDGRLRLTHSCAVSGIKPPPPIVDVQVPVWTSMWRRGEMFSVSDVEELPDNQWREKKYCREMGGIKSLLFIPMIIGGETVGLMFFASYNIKRTWPDIVVQRLRLLGDVFGNALERKWADQKMQKAIAEIKMLKDRLEAENIYLRDQIKTELTHEEIVGQSDPIRKVFQQIEQVAPTGATVLILGETGTGKELITRAIHKLSGRRQQVMIKLNCAALPASLIEAELFGREKGAYTGALTTQIGRFEAANGSTIFLDEIGELPLELQAKLLRVLQDGQFERLGSSKPIKVDVRVIAATNKDLAKAVKEGRFREDLYYRLNVFPIHVPPLRERTEDIPLLVWSVINELSKVLGKTIEVISKKDMDYLKGYHWPGNVRELRNVVERAMILSKDSTFVLDLPETPVSRVGQAASLEEAERAHILSVLTKTGWRVRGGGGAAEILGLKPTTLESKMKKLSIKRAN